MWHRDRPGVVRVAEDTSLAGWRQQAVECVDVLGAAVEPDAVHEAEAAIAGRVGLPDDAPVARIVGAAVARAAGTMHHTMRRVINTHKALVPGAAADAQR